MNDTHTKYNGTVPGLPYLGVDAGSPWIPNVFAEVVAAVKLQYEESMSTESETENNVSAEVMFRAVWQTLGFCSSPYALVCFAVALTLNRVALHLQGHRHREPKYVYEVGHALCAAALFYTMWELAFGNILPLGVFFVFTISCFAESVLCLWRGARALEHSEYTIFELAVLLYATERSKSFNWRHRSSPLSSSGDYDNVASFTESADLMASKIRPSIGNLLALFASVPAPIADCYSTLASRLIVHTLELSNARYLRTALTSVVYLVHTSHIVLSRPVSRLAICRHGPGIVALIVVAVSLAVHILARIAAGPQTTFQLQWKTLIDQLNCTGEQECSALVLRLATLLCNVSALRGPNPAGDSPQEWAPVRLTEVCTELGDYSDSEYYLESTTDSELDSESEPEELSDADALANFTVDARKRTRSRPLRLRECVVCRVRPRTVVVWPCGCLALCAHCRDALTLRGFQQRCSCCRAEVAAYSELS